MPSETLATLQGEVGGISFRFNAGELVKITLSNNQSSAIYIKSVTVRLGKGNGQVYARTGKDTYAYRTSDSSLTALADLRDEAGELISGKVAVSKSVDVLKSKNTGDDPTGYFKDIGNNPEYDVTFNLTESLQIDSGKTTHIYVYKSETNNVAISTRKLSNTGVAVGYCRNSGSPNLGWVTVTASPSPMMFGKSTEVSWTEGFDPESYDRNSYGDRHGYQYNLSPDGGITWSGWTPWGYPEGGGFAFLPRDKDTNSAVQFKVLIMDEDYENPYAEVTSNVVRVQLNQPSKSRISPNPISIGESVSAVDLSTTDTAVGIVYEGHKWYLNNEEEVPGSAGKEKITPTQTCYHRYQAVASNGFLSSELSEKSDNLTIHYSPRRMIDYGFNCSFSSKSEDSTLSPITQDFLFIPTNDIVVSWSKFSLDNHQGKFNKYVIKVVDVTSGSVVIEQSGSNNYTEGNSVEISGILDKIKSNEMVPGHTFEIKLECWYYDEKGNKKDDLEGSEIGTNIITSRRFLLAGLPDNPDILYPDSRRSNNLTLNSQPRIIFTCKNPDYLPRSICQIKSATVSYSLIRQRGVETVTHRVFINYENGIPSITKESSSNFLSVKNGEGEEIVFVYRMNDLSNDVDRQKSISITCTNDFDLTSQDSVTSITYKNFNEAVKGGIIQASEASNLGDYCIESVRSYQRIPKELAVPEDRDYFIENKVTFSPEGRTDYLDKQTFLSNVQEGEDFTIKNESDQIARVSVVRDKVSKVKRANVSMALKYADRFTKEVKLNKADIIEFVGPAVASNRTEAVSLGYYKSIDSVDFLRNDHPNYPVYLPSGQTSISDEGIVEGREGDLFIKEVNIVDVSKYLPSRKNGIARYPLATVSSVKVNYYPADTIEVVNDGAGNFKYQWSKLSNFRICTQYILLPDYTTDVVSNPMITGTPRDNPFVTPSEVYEDSAHPFSDGSRYCSYRYECGDITFNYNENEPVISITQTLSSGAILLDIRAAGTYMDEDGNCRTYDVSLSSNDTVTEITNPYICHVMLNSVTSTENGTSTELNFRLDSGDTITSSSHPDLFNQINLSSSRLLNVSYDKSRYDKTGYNSHNLDVVIDTIEDSITGLVVTPDPVDIVDDGSGDNIVNNTVNVDSKGYDVKDIKIVSGGLWLGPEDTVEMFTNWSSGSAEYPSDSLEYFIECLNIRNDLSMYASVNPSENYLLKDNNLQTYYNSEDWRLIFSFESPEMIVDTVSQELVGSNVITVPRTRTDSSSKYEEVTITNSTESGADIIIQPNNIIVSPGSSYTITRLQSNTDEITVAIQISEDTRPDTKANTYDVPSGNSDNPLLVDVDEEYIVTGLSVSFPYYHPESPLKRKLYLLSKSASENLEDALSYYIPEKTYQTLFDHKFIRPASVGDEVNSPRQILLEWLSQWFLYEDPEDTNYLGLYGVIKSYGSEASQVVSKDSVNGHKKDVDLIKARPWSGGLTPEYYKGNIFNIIVDILKYML